jgi:uncharacterized protein YbbC (DUF1343 family)
MGDLMFYIYVAFFMFSYTHAQREPLRLGIDNVSAVFQKRLAIHKQTLQYALITNHTGKNLKGQHSIDILRARGFTITYLLAPEHGITGAIAAQKDIAHGYDTVSKTPIISLYSNGSGKGLTQAIVDTIDGFIFDIQDVGMRHYTYVSTLLRMLQTAANNQKIFIVLDRPNILGGRMEGPLVSDTILERKSFIAAAPIPLRHGMTVGELARYFNTHVLEKSASLYVVPMTGYERQIALPDTLIYHLSPNIINKQACYGYSFLGLLGEVRPFDVGIGTKAPFTRIGIANTPVNPAKLALLRTQLAHRGITTQICTYFNQRKRKDHHGISLHIDNIEAVSSFNTFLCVLQFFKDIGIRLEFSEYFDHAVGTDMVRHYVQGQVSYTQLKREINLALEHFFHKAHSIFIYLPWPTLALIE